MKKAILINLIAVLGILSFICQAQSTEKETEDSNLVKNPSAENVKYNYPVGWGKGRASGKFEWGVSEEEKHSGKYSVYVKLKEFFEDKKGAKKGFGGGITLGKGIVFKPDTEYKFSFWMKTTAPYIRIWTNQFKAEGKPLYSQRTSLGVHLKPTDEEWHEYTGKFVTAANVNSIVLCFYLHGREKQWASNPGIPLGTVMYIDDVDINEARAKK